MVHNGNWLEQVNSKAKHLQVNQLFECYQGQKSLAAKKKKMKIGKMPFKIFLAFNFIIN